MLICGERVAHQIVSQAHEYATGMMSDCVDVFIS